MAHKPLHIVPLASETRTHLTTAEAAVHMNRAEQTLRLWAMRENGPVRPVRVFGRLAWPVAEIRRALGLREVEEHAHTPAQEARYGLR